MCIEEERGGGEKRVRYGWGEKGFNLCTYMRLSSARRRSRRESASACSCLAKCVPVRRSEVLASVSRMFVGQGGAQTGALAPWPTFTGRETAAQVLAPSPRSECQCVIQWTNSITLTMALTQHYGKALIERDGKGGEFPLIKPVCSSFMHMVLGPDTVRLLYFKCSSRVHACTLKFTSLSRGGGGMRLWTLYSEKRNVLLQGQAQVLKRTIDHQQRLAVPVSSGCQALRASLARALRLRLGSRQI